MRAPAKYAPQWRAPCREAVQPPAEREHHRPSHATTRSGLPRAACASTSRERPSDGPCRSPRPKSLRVHAHNRPWQPTLSLRKSTPWAAAVEERREVPDLAKAPVPAGRSPGHPRNPGHADAAGSAASFLGIMKYVAGQEGIAFPSDTEVEASVGVGSTPPGYGIEAELRIGLPGLPRAEADVLVEKSHAACPYSNATRDNVSVRLVLA